MALRKSLKLGEMRDSRKSSEGAGTMPIAGVDETIPVSGVIGTMSGMMESTIDSLMRCFQ